MQRKYPAHYEPGTVLRFNAGTFPDDSVGRACRHKVEKPPARCLAKSNVTVKRYHDKIDNLLTCEHSSRQNNNLRTRPSLTPKLNSTPDGVDGDMPRISLGGEFLNCFAQNIFYCSASQN